MSAYRGLREERQWVARLIWQIDQLVIADAQGAKGREKSMEKGRNRDHRLLHGSRQG